MDLLSTDASAAVDDQEPFFHLANSSATASSNPRRSADRVGFDFRTDDVLPNYDFQASRKSNSMKARSNSSTRLEEGSLNRQHRPSSITGVGSTVYLTGELSPVGRKDLDMESYNAQLVSAVERTMKKYADNILRVLEGMSGRLSQLESITEDLDVTVTSIKVSVNEYHDEADGKLRMLDNRVMEMHRALQILRDKQDIAEAHAELAKLQSSKIDASAEKSSAGRSSTNQVADSGQTLKQHQIPVHMAPSTAQATQSIQPIVSVSHQHEDVGQLPSISSQSLNSLPQQYFPVQTQFQQHEPQHPQGQPVQQFLPPQDQISSSVQGQGLQHQHQHQHQQQQQQQQQPQQQHQHQHQHQQHQQQQLHLQPQPAVQQPLSSQQQISQSLPQALQAQLSLTPTQQIMQQPAQGLQSLSHRGSMQQLLQQERQLQLYQQPTPSAQSHLEQSQSQILPQSMQFQQAFTQQASAQQPVQQLPHAPHSSSTQSVTGQQAMQAQIVAQTSQMQQGSGQSQAQQLPANGVSFQQYAHNNETQLYSSHPPGSTLQVPFVQGGYVAESPFAPANFASNQQQVPPISQQSNQMATQNYNPHQRNSPSGTPLPPSQPAYEPNVTGHYSGPMTWTGQNPSTIPVARQNLPSAQPVQNEPFSGRRSLPPNQAPIDGVVERVVAMGFSRDQVRTVIKKLSENGQSVDMNIVLDILMNGRRDN